MIFISLLTLIIFLIFPVEIAKSAGDALNMCIASVIPSLFPFMVITKFITLSGRFDTDNFFFRMIGRALKISSVGAYAFLLGLICGYPMGGKIVCDLRKENKISKKEGAHLMTFVNNAGPAFCIATVGGAFLNNIRAGVVIYFSHIIVSALTAFVMSFFAPSVSGSFIKPTPAPLDKAFVSSVSDSMTSIVNITGIIIFFSSLSALIEISGISFFDGFPGILKGLFEMTGGIKALSLSHLPFELKASLSAFLVSFSGLSVFCQILSFSEDIKITPCIICKVLGAVVTALISYLFITL